MRRVIAALVLAVLAVPIGADAQLAAKAVPRIGFLGNLDAENQARNVAAFQEGLRDLGWIEGQTLMTKARTVEVTDVAEYEGAFRIAKSERAQAVYVLPSPIFNAHRKRLVELAAQYRLPAAYD